MVKRVMEDAPHAGNSVACAAAGGRARRRQLGRGALAHETGPQRRCYPLPLRERVAKRAALSRVRGFCSMSHHRAIADRQRGFARKMRREPTTAEQRLWLLLRSSRLDGQKFRRQVPMGAFIADFVCHECRLIVEADGGQHGSDADALRDEWFRAAGYRVLRFWNNDVLQNPNGVLDIIVLAIAQYRR